MVTIVDHGYANVGSVQNMCRKLDVACILSADPEVVAKADFLILPGVGAFDAGMARLKELGLVEALNQAVINRGVPLVGICLGMQFLMEGSEEGVLPGLGYIKGRVVKFPAGMLEDGKPLKVPHMGWNVAKAKPDAKVFDVFMKGEQPTFYFVHSYYAFLKDPSDELATAQYGVNFTAAVRRDNVCGFQFHPEKSHDHGMRLLTGILPKAS